MSDVLKLKGFSFDRLETFIQVARLGSMSQAAKATGMQVPHISKHISDLERVFGVVLFDGRGRHTKLSEAGERLLSLARLPEEALKEFHSWCADRPAELRIGAGESVLQWIVFPRLAELQRKLPKTNFVFLNLKSSEIATKLSRGELDLGILHDEAAGERLERQSIGSMEFRLFVPRKLLAASGERAPKGEILRTLPLALLEGSGRYRRVIDQFFCKRRLPLEANIFCSSLTQLSAVLQAQTHGAFLPVAVAGSLPEEHFMALDHPLARLLKLKLILAWNQRTATVKPSIDQVRSLFTTGS